MLIKIFDIFTLLPDPEVDKEIPPSEAEGAEIAGLIACSICGIILCVIFLTDIITSQIHLTVLLYNLQDGWINVKEILKTITDLPRTIRSIQIVRKPCKQQTVSKVEKVRQPPVYVTTPDPVNTVQKSQPGLPQRTIRPADMKTSAKSGSSISYITREYQLKSMHGTVVPKPASSDNAVAQRPATVYNTESPVPSRPASMQGTAVPRPAPMQRTVVPEPTLMHSTAVLRPAPMQSTAVPRPAPMQSTVVPRPTPMQSSAVPRQAPIHRRDVPVARVAPMQNVSLPRPAPMQSTAVLRPAPVQSTAVLRPVPMQSVGSSGPALIQAAVSIPAPVAARNSSTVHRPPPPAAIHCTSNHTSNRSENII